jgi:chorismate mutase-like protein
MSNTAPNAEPPQADAVPETLAELRAALDRLDDGIHDLLMQRADVVMRVAKLIASGKVPYRPGREAQIIRRMLARHAGPLPRRAVPRLWAELFAATRTMQERFALAVCDSVPPVGLAACAREHFGALTPMRMHGSPAQAIAEVSSGAATCAVLPLPGEGEPLPAAWWLKLLNRDEPRLYVIGRLPFFRPRPDGAPQGEALVLSTAPPDASGRDRALLGFEVPAEMSRARLTTELTAAGLTPLGIILRRDPTGAAAFGLLEVDGLMAEDDPRLVTLAQSVRRPVILGGYAVPTEENGS